MSDLLDISAGRIILRDAAGNLRFDTNQQSLMLASRFQGSLSFPARAAGVGGANLDRRQIGNVFNGANRIMGFVQVQAAGFDVATGNCVSAGQTIIWNTFHFGQELVAYLQTSIQIIGTGIYFDYEWHARDVIGSSFNGFNALAFNYDVYAGNFI